MDSRPALTFQSLSERHAHFWLNISEDRLPSFSFLTGRKLIPADKEIPINFAVIAYYVILLAIFWFLSESSRVSWFFHRPFDGGQNEPQDDQLNAAIRVAVDHGCCCWSWRYFY